jgi:hypothetical protein
LQTHRGDQQAGGSPITLIVDSGPLYAYVDEDDGDHDASLELLESHPGPLLVPQLVVAEVAYFIESRLGWIAETRFLGDLASGNFATAPVHPGHWIRIAELVARYRDLRLGTVDASVVAPAERLVSMSSPRWIDGTLLLSVRNTHERLCSFPDRRSFRAVAYHPIPLR